MPLRINLGKFPSTKKKCVSMYTMLNHYYPSAMATGSEAGSASPVLAQTTDILDQENL